MGEFDLIERYFKRPAHQAVLGVGDDCALLLPAPGMHLAVSSDMLVEGRHFVSTVDPERLVGGDTTQGPLNICITVMGEVPPGDALLRHNAQVGDDIYISGTVGDARLALEVFRGTQSLDAAGLEQARLRMEQPTPRVALGLALRAVANAAIDISDGLLGDLGHILKRSGVGAQIDTHWLQNAATFGDGQAAGITPWLAALPWHKRLEFALAGGDDYELCFTAPVNQREMVHAAAWESDTPVTRIGRITEAPGLVLHDPQGQPITRRFASFDHFA